MSFKHKLNNKKGDPRPSTFWNDVDMPLTRVLSPEHKGHYDIQYKDSSGKVQARMDGLIKSEAQYLKEIRGF